MDEEFPPTTRERSARPWQSPNMSFREMVGELERLAIHFPRTDMDARKWMVLFQTFWDDCQHLNLDQLRRACQNYRQNPESRFFPTPGQLVDALNTRDEPGSRRRSEAISGRMVDGVWQPWQGCECSKCLAARAQYRADNAWWTEWVERQYPRGPVIHYTPEQRMQVLRDLAGALKARTAMPKRQPSYTPGVDS